jgi:hypothetical protein
VRLRSLSFSMNLIPDLLGLLPIVKLRYFANNSCWYVRNVAFFLL